MIQNYRQSFRNRQRNKGHHQTQAHQQFRGQANRQAGRLAQVPVTGQTVHHRKPQHPPLELLQRPRAGQALDENPVDAGQLFNTRRQVRAGAAEAP